MPSLIRLLAWAFAVAAAGFLVADMRLEKVASAAPSNGRGYRNDTFRVRSFEPPASWQAAPQPSYPRLLVEFTHPDGGRITLGAQRVAAGTSADALARAARPGLERQGFSDIQIAAEGKGVRLEARLDAGRRFLKQLYLVDGSLGYVVSLVAGSVNQPEMARDFDTAARSLTITAEPQKAPPPPGDGGSAH